MFGIVWAIINPILTVLIFSFVFGVVFQARWGIEATSNGEFVIIVLLGMIVHGIFAESLGRAPTLIVGQPAYVKKVVFPLEILPIVAVLHALLNAAIGFTVVVIAYLTMTGHIEATVLLLPIVLLPYVLLIIGVVLFASAIGVYLRDLAQIVNVITMIALFLAPIFYPISAVPERYQLLLYLNPLTFTVEQARNVALFGNIPNWTGLTIYFIAASSILATYSQLTR